MKSNAPRRVACIASVIVPWPEIITTGSVSSTLADLGEHFEAVHARHLDVEQHDVGRFAPDLRDAVRAGRGADELVVLVFEDHPQRVADRRLVVDDQDAGFHVRGNSNSSNVFE